jgi:hypothetical protein
MKHVLLYMAVMAMLLSACSNSNYDKGQPAVADATMELAEQTVEKVEEDKIAADTSVTQAKFTPPQITATHQDWDKKIIKTADITLELRNYNNYNSKLHTGLKAYGAYIASEEQEQDDYRISNNITIKVPVEQFDNLVNSFSGDDIKVIEKKIGSEDVTAEVIDTKSRIEAKKQVRDRYLDLLKQARNMKEILEVQREINTIQEDLESASGRVNYLTHQSAYSTIRLTYYQFLNGVSRDHSNSFGVRLKESLDTGIRIIGNLMIFMVSLWPVWVVVAIGILWWKRKRPVKQ